MKQNGQNTARDEARERPHSMQTVSTADYRPRALNIGTPLFCCLLLCAVAFKALASDPHLLAPPDRSSPRATLQSFITHMDAAQRAYTSGTDGADVARAFRQAIDCLDLSKVAPTLHCDVGGYSALLLKEILDRLDLPTADAISGLDTDQAHWTIPQTEIVDIGSQHLVRASGLKSAASEPTPALPKNIRSDPATLKAANAEEEEDCD